MAAVALLSGCAAVYVPTSPRTPLLEKGQVEVTAGLHSVRYGEVGAAWSPIPHVLVTGELATNLVPSTTTTTNDQGASVTYKDTHRQGGVGLGLYRAPTATSTSYLAVMGGLGWGHTKFFASEDYQVTSPFLPIPVPTRNGVYDAHYRRYYGQVYFACPVADKSVQFGGSLRSVWLDYTNLTYADQPFRPSNRVFLEPSLFMRIGQGPLRYYATAGLSVPLSDDPNNPANRRTASQSYVVSGGIILRPDLLRRHRE